MVKALDTKDLKDAVENYIRRYNELLAASTYFKKGTFDYFNAGQIAKSLAANGFFDAKHICFLRNLIEMTTGEDDDNYKSLTAMLHWKGESAKLKISDLDAIYNDLCKAKGASVNSGRLVYEVIGEEADACLNEPAGLNLENKIVLAMATRLSAERFMIGKINDDKFVSEIKANQTQALISKFKAKFPAEAAAIGCLDRVALMTPENIHVNSFMYEPIVDMSDEHLKRLYRDAKKLV